MLFPDYNETGIVYHVAPITDLDKILKAGIKYNDKVTYKTKYLGFHRYIDSFKKYSIPKWVIREKAIFSSLNFKKDHCWHSHSIIMGLKINPEKCWVANENLANEIYEPFILKDVDRFKCAKKYIDTRGSDILNEYWNTSLSFLNNLQIRRDYEKNYDAEVMIFHDIKPEDIKLIAMVSDHKFMSIESWHDFFTKGECIDEDREITK